MEDFERPEEKRREIVDKLGGYFPEDTARERRMLRTHRKRRIEAQLEESFVHGMYCGMGLGIFLTFLMLSACLTFAPSRVLALCMSVVGLVMAMCNAN